MPLSIGSKLEYFLCLRLFVPMVAFSKPRLEGRALEHAIEEEFGNKRFRHILMFHDGEATRVATVVARRALSLARERWREVSAELRAAGFFPKGGQQVAKWWENSKKTTIQRKSVDLRLHKPGVGEVLVELKWTRHSGWARSFADAHSSWTPFRHMVSGRGQWEASYHKVAAADYGSLVLKPTTWQLRLCTGTVATNGSVAARPAKRSKCGWDKRKGNPRALAKDLKWKRRSPKWQASQAKSHAKSNPCRCRAVPGAMRGRPRKKHKKC